MFDIVTCGELLAEFVAERLDQPFDATGSFKGPFPSGAPAIFASQAARLGARVAHAGRVGQDSFGDLIIERLVADGIDIEAVERDPEWPTGTAFVSYRRDGSRRFIFNLAHSAAGQQRLEADQLERLSASRYFHVMGSSLNSAASIDIILRLAARVKERGGRISFDPNIRPELIAEQAVKDAILQLVNDCDVFLPSEADLEWLGEGRGETEANTISRLLGNHAMQLLVVKRAAEGCQAFFDDRGISVASFEVREVDPTGAGDCFGGALVAALSLGEPLEKALTLANAAGAHAVTCVGPMEGCSHRDTLLSLIQQHKGAK